MIHEKKHLAPPTEQDLHRVMLSDMNLSKRLYRRLSNEGLLRLSEIVAFTENKLHDRGFNLHSVMWLQRYLAKQGVSLLCEQCKTNHLRIPNTPSLCPLIPRRPNRLTTLTA